MGARPMARVIRVHIKKPLADEVLPPPCCTPMGHFPPGTLAALKESRPTPPGRPLFREKIIPRKGRVEGTGPAQIGRSRNRFGSHR